MFGLSFTEVLIILALALIVLGPKRLPEMARTIGKGLRELRKASEDLKGTFDAEIYRDEAPYPSPSRKGLPPAEPWRPSDAAADGYPDTGGYEDVPAEGSADASGERPDEPGPEGGPGEPGPGAGRDEPSPDPRSDAPSPDHRRDEPGGA